MIKLSPAARQFILHWGEMGSRWGITRSVAQVHALLYVSDGPLCADEIAATLTIARSNVSTAIRELQVWGLARVVHQAGDRHDYFSTSGDAWETLQLVAAERKHREIDPAIAMLRQCLADSRGADSPAEARIRDMLQLLETTTTFYEQVRGLPKSTLLKLMKLGRHLVRVLDRAAR
jgi:DNA-binding transcriptional regulator GbsR (MarR family)